MKKLEGTFVSLNKTPEEVEILINLFRSKLDNLVYEIDNNSIKELQKSIIKYNTMVRYMMP